MMLGSAQTCKEKKSWLRGHRTLREEDYYGMKGRKDFSQRIKAELNPECGGGKDSPRGKDRQKKQQIQTCWWRESEASLLNSKRTGRSRRVAHDPVTG